MKTFETGRKFRSWLSHARDGRTRFKMQRVIISGIGIITPAGNTAFEFFDSVIDGRSGLRRITRFDTSNCRVKIGGEAHLPENQTCLPPKLRSRLDRTSQMAVLAAS